MDRGLWVAAPVGAVNGSYDDGHVALEVRGVPQRNSKCSRTDVPIWYSQTVPFWNALSILERTKEYNPFGLEGMLRYIGIAPIGARE